MTASQTANDVALLKWMALDWRRPLTTQDKTATLWEHKEMIRFGSAPTACPSGRIPWTTIIAALEEDVMNEADKQWVIDEIGRKLSGDGGGSLALILNSLANYPRLNAEFRERVNEEIAKHAATPHGGTAGPHKHTISGETD